MCYVIEVFSGFYIIIIMFYCLLNYLLEVYFFYVCVGYFDMCLFLLVMVECVGIYVSIGEIISQ